MSTARQKQLYKDLMGFVIEKGMGGKIPPQDVLAKKYKCSRTLLREVLAIMEFLDIISVRPKHGTVINPTSQWSFVKRNPTDNAVSNGVISGDTDQPTFTCPTGPYDKYSVEEWTEMLEKGLITSSDGIGYWCKDAYHESTVSAFHDKPEWATCVTWYNK